YTLGRDGTLDVVLSTERRPGAHRVTFDFDGTTAAGIATYTTVMGIYKAPTTVEVAAGVWTQELGVTFTATVANAESWIAPTSGVVQFYVDNALMGEAIVGHDHVARWTTKALPLGVRTVVAVYRESANFQASQSAPIQVPIVPRRIETTTTLTSSANPAAPGERLKVKDGMEFASHPPVGQSS
ncbi:MAG: Ig-like domain repeat protein, partial [Mesorhizobium sp.]|nr:Ig-like domain repeat protein [Mesorhizobium sp.]